MPSRPLTPSDAPRADHLEEEVRAPEDAAERATTQLVDGLIEAYSRWDEPAHVAARAALEAEREQKIVALLEESYLSSGQRGSAPMDVAIQQMTAYFAGRIEAAAQATDPLPPLHQALPEIDNGGYVVLELLASDGDRRRLELRVESPSGENEATELVQEGTVAELLSLLRSPALADRLLPAIERLTAATHES